MSDGFTRMDNAPSVHDAFEEEPITPTDSDVKKQLFDESRAAAAKEEQMVLCPHHNASKPPLCLEPAAD